MTFTGQLVEGLDVVADRATWLAWRRSHIGASDVAAVLGISPWASPWSLWAEKCSLVPEQEANEVMTAGRWFELSIGPWFAHETGLYVVGEQAVIEAADDPLAGCTLDGGVTETPDALLEDALGGVEMKSDGPGRRWAQIPAHYQAQGQWQMYVTGWERVWFAVLTGRRLDVHELERDDSDILFIKSRVDRFWSEFVVAGMPPPTDGHDATLRAIAEVYPTHTPELSVELDDLADVLDQWREAKTAKSAAEKLEKEAKAAIQAALGDAEEGTVGGERVVSWREQTRKSYVVEEATFRVLRPTSPKKKEQAA